MRTCQIKTTCSVLFGFDVRQDEVHTIEIEDQYYTIIHSFIQISSFNFDLLFFKWKIRLNFISSPTTKGKTHLTVQVSMHVVFNVVSLKKMRITVKSIYFFSIIIQKKIEFFFLLSLSCSYKRIYKMKTINFNRTLKIIKFVWKLFKKKKKNEFYVRRSTDYCTLKQMVYSGEKKETLEIVIRIAKKILDEV